MSRGCEPRWPNLGSDILEGEYRSSGHGKRLQFVARRFADESMTELCHQFGISGKAGCAKHPDRIRCAIMLESYPKGQLFGARKSERGMDKKPMVRVTKWLSDIPIEAQCTACPTVSFRAKVTNHRPNREEYKQSLQAQFDEHCRFVHA